MPKDDLEHEKEHEKEHELFQQGARRSRELLAAHSGTFAEDVRHGGLVCCFDGRRGGQFLMEADAAKMKALTGADLGRPITTAKLIDRVRAFSFGGLVVLAVVVFRWWAVLVVPLLFLVRKLGVTNTVYRGGGFSLIVALGFLLSLLLVTSPVQAAWSVAGIVFGLSQRARYAYPEAALRQPALDFPTLREMLVLLYVLTLRHPS